MQFADFEENGFGILENFLDPETVLHLTEAVSNLKIDEAVSRKKDSIYGVRNLLSLPPEIRAFSESEIVRKTASKIIGKNAKVVRAIFFNKTADANWKVPWHQDLTIAVKEKRETKGFTAWTVKAGIAHVQPPVEILEKMVTLRFHLDDTDESNGALKVIPKSHIKGRLSAKEVQDLRKSEEIKICSTKKGDCLLMRPLLLHASSQGNSPNIRRVIHFEFSTEDLPNNLEWHETV